MPRWGGGSYLLRHERSETEHDCETSAYWGTYYDVRRAVSESAYSSTNENPPATRRKPSLSERRPKP